MLHAEDGEAVQDVAEAYKGLLLQWVSSSQMMRKAFMSRYRLQERESEVRTFPHCAGTKRTNAKCSSEGSLVAL